MLDLTTTRTEELETKVVLRPDVPASRKSATKGGFS
jgi:hypothetical protein